MAMSATHESAFQRPTPGGSTPVSEKPFHYTYLKEFRVEQCKAFLQHKCNQYCPFTCFHWHFMNQRRRRPMKRRDGTFNYSPDVYCNLYDENTGICPNGDECPYLHRTAGDTERRYHLRYYKTEMCVYETDTRGYCVKNGPHCAFAHGPHDLRPPVYDIRELQGGDEEDRLMSPLVGSLEKERGVLVDDPRWQESSFVLTYYKTEPCKRPPRLCRQGYACPFFHNNKDRRRSPEHYKYRSTPCPNVKLNDEWGDPTHCDQADTCCYCHTRTEQQFHPESYKSTKCNDVQQTGYCPRGPFCAFAHDEKEFTAPCELTDAPMAINPSPIVVTTDSTLDTDAILYWTSPFTKSLFQPISRPDRTTVASDTFQKAPGAEVKSRQGDMHVVAARLGYQSTMAWTGLENATFTLGVAVMSATISHANQYQALPLLFYFSSGRGGEPGNKARTEEFTAPCELTDAPMAINPSPIVVTTGSTLVYMPFTKPLLQPISRPDRTTAASDTFQKAPGAEVKSKSLEDEGQSCIRKQIQVIDGDTSLDETERTRRKQNLLRLSFASASAGMSPEATLQPHSLHVPSSVSYALEAMVVRGLDDLTLEDIDPSNLTDKPPEMLSAGILGHSPVDEGFCQSYQSQMPASYPYSTPLGPLSPFAAVSGSLPSSGPGPLQHMQTVSPGIGFTSTSTLLQSIGTPSPFHYGPAHRYTKPTELSSMMQVAMGSPSEKTELAALREELRQTKAHLASWHESWKQAKQACDAWKREAEEANSRMRMERESARRKIKVPQPNLLSPSLEWRKCQKMPVSVLNGQAVVLENKVFIGGGSMNPSPPSRLLIYDFTEDTWDITDTPTQWYAFTTYHSKLVLVGGKDPKTKKATNQLWVLDEQYHWTQPLPPMTTKRYKASAVSEGDHLIVAGGQGGSHVCPLDEVEVYDGHQWRKVQSLPRACTWMKSTLHEGNWYLAGGNGQSSEVYQTSLESLIATSEGDRQTSVWKKLPDAPVKQSATVIFRNQLMTVGGGSPLSSALHAYSPSTNLWVHVENLPVACHSTCTVVLPTGELLVVGGKSESGLLHCPFRARIGVPSSPTELPDSQQEAALEITGYLKGVDVIAETSVLITNQARTIHWRGYGMKLHIPQGALPPGLEECRLLMKVGLSGQFELPENTSLVSAVYWLDSEPRCKFSQHLTMEIQHCVQLTLASKLSFVHARCSQKHLPYTFEAKEGGKFSTESTYGCVQLTHFSIWSLIYKMLVPGVLYCARLYHLRKGVNRIDIHFVITKDLEAHATVVEQKYSDKGATFEAEMRLEFESDCISLQLPSEEEIIDGGWRIVALCHPGITKEQVDSFTPGRGIPSCQLAAKWIGQGSPSELSHKVTLEGAREPSNFFRIVLGYDTARHHLTSASGDTSVEYSQAPIPNIKDLMKALYHTVADKWEPIGIHLDLPSATLSTIAAEHQSDPHKCLIGMLKVWLKIVDPLPTWSAIIEAVEFLGEKQLARELREKYCQQTC